MSPLGKVRLLSALRPIALALGAGSAKELIYQGIVNASLSRLPNSPNLFPVGAAANYSLLYLILRLIEDTSVERILEIGAGQSTLFLDALRSVRPFELITLEADHLWADRVRSKVKHEVLHAPLAMQKIVHGKLVPSFTRLPSGKFDAVIVDAPQGQRRFSRWCTLDVLDEILAEQFLVIFDDAERSGEQDTIREFKRHHAGDCTTIHGLKAQHVVFTERFAAAKYF